MTSFPTLITRLRELMKSADNAIINNDHTCQIEEGHIYVKRGENECCVALPQCEEWSKYIAALIQHAPEVLIRLERLEKVAEAAKKMVSDAEAKLGGFGTHSFSPEHVNFDGLLRSLAQLYEEKTK